ncbi:MAG: hypothetical protein WDN23_13110 [Edaphobacter sp.]
MRQLFAYRADDPERKLSGIVLEVKGDLCRQLQRILKWCGRERDYVEVSLDGDIRYNPLNNSLDPYAQAFNIASIITSIWGKGREPFWQQSYIRAYFEKQGLSDAALNNASADFCRETLGHAQRALQNASALKRLAGTLPTSATSSLTPTSQQEWTEMATKHAAALEAELRALQEQLMRLSSSAESREDNNRGHRVDAGIHSPAQFAAATDQLLVKTKDLDESVIRTFASSPTTDAQPPDIPSFLATTRHAIPIESAAEMTSFAVQLSSSGRTAAINRQHSRPNAQPPQ